MHSAHWQPLFSGRAAEPYEEVILAVVGALDAHEVSAADWGRPLLHAYLAEARQSSAHRERADDLIDQAVDALATGRMRPSLYDGVAGTGWLVAHTDALCGRRDEDAFADIDQFLLQTLRVDRHPRDYDLISGPVGMGVYFLERLPDATAREGLQQVVDTLTGQADRTDEHARWFTSPSNVPESQKELAPNGYYNLGVAHGAPGIVGLLAGVVEAGLCGTLAETLLRDAAR